jgi:hypothetical protein
MTNYTIIAYRPNYTDMCRGCVVGRSSSEHEISFFETLEDAAKKGAEYEIWNEEKDTEYDDWEITLLIDGIDSDTWWLDRSWPCEETDPFETFCDLKRDMVTAEIERRRVEKERLKELEEAKKRRKATEAAIAKERAEREKLRELLEKYPEESR